MSKVEKARRRMESFSARGSKCPICKADFRGDKCPHSVKQAEAKLFQNYIKAIASEES